MNNVVNPIFRFGNAKLQNYLEKHSWLLSFLKKIEIYRIKQLAPCRNSQEI